MPLTVFYSWQTDLPNATNRGFIQQALENAASTIKKDDSIQVDPVIDRDTEGVAGSPDIAATIFEKIEKARVFACDVSIINSGGESRLTPNPNVLVELGYAMRALGPDRIIMVFNTAFGKVEDLPFDLRMRRVITYHMPVESTRAEERRNLERKLDGQLRAVFAGIGPIKSTSDNSRVIRQLIRDELEGNVAAVEHFRRQALGLDGNFRIGLESAPVRVMPDTVWKSHMTDKHVVGEEERKSLQEIYRLFTEISNFQTTHKTLTDALRKTRKDIEDFLENETASGLVFYSLRERVTGLEKEVLLNENHFSATYNRIRHLWKDLEPVLSVNPSSDV